MTMTGVKTHCKPTSDSVRSAMRTLSLEPLIDGVPDHCATVGMVPLRLFILTGLRAKVRYVGTESRALRVLGEWNVAFGDDARV